MTSPVFLALPPLEETHRQWLVLGVQRWAAFNAQLAAARVIGAVEAAQRQAAGERALAAVRAAGAVLRVDVEAARALRLGVDHLMGVHEPRADGVDPSSPSWVGFVSWVHACEAALERAGHSLS